MNNPLILALVILLLAGCSPDAGPVASSTDNPANAAADGPAATPSDETLNVLSVTGAETMEFDYTLQFSCLRDMASVLTMTQAPKFTMYLPAGIETGRYELAEYDANADPSYVEGKAVVTFTGAVQRGSGSTYGNFFFKPVDGELVIERMPGGRGERFIADLDATLGDGDGATVTLTGRIDIEETGSMSMDCAY